MNTTMGIDSARAAALQSLQSGFWFACLPEALRLRMMAEASIVRLEAGQQLFAYGDSELGMYAVVSGGISIGRHSEDGKESLLTLIETPNWFGEITLFDRGCRTHNAHAVGKTVLVEVNGAALDRILSETPSYWQNFGQLLTLKLRLLLDMAEDMALRTTAQRLAKRLVMLAISNGDLTGRSRRVVEVQQEQLAMMLFITRQTTNQILKNLERLGLIKLVYGAVEILDLEGLQRYTEQAF